MPMWRSAESSPGASASALDGPELALRRLFGGRRDIHHGYLHRSVRGAALISVNRAIFDAAYSHQYHMQGACKIADRPATDRSDPPKRSSPGRTAAQSQQ